VKTVSAELDEDGEKKFMVVKKSMGLLADADVLRVLIVERYNELTERKSIVVSKGLYDLLERKAEREGKTVETLVNELVERRKKEEEEKKDE